MMIASDYIRLYTGSFIMIQSMVNALSRLHIIPIIKDISESARLAGFGAPIAGQQILYVHKDEIDKAVPVVEDILAGN